MRTAALLLSALLPLGAQTIIESAILTGSTATKAGAAGKAAGNAIGTSLSKSASVLDKAASGQGSAPAARSTTGGQAATSAAVLAAPVPDEKPLPKPTTDQVKSVTPGLTRSELIAKLGKPAQSISIPDGSVLVERFRYTTESGDQFRVVLEDGKVKEVTSAK